MSMNKASEKESTRLAANFEKEMSDDKFPDASVTQEELSIYFGKGRQSQVDKQMLNRVNEIVNMDFVMLQSYKENFLNFTEALNGMNVSIDAYIDAVRYVSYVVNGSTNQKAYMRTFPGRYKRMLDEGYDEQRISSYVNGYNKGKLVSRIHEQARIPTHILNAGTFQDAINTQARLMRTAKSEKVQSDAANSLMTHLKAPEKTMIELDVGMKQDASVMELRETLRKLAETQTELINNGVKTGTIAASKLVGSNVEDDLED